jgi:hypothetical protein
MQFQLTVVFSIDSDAMAVFQPTVAIPERYGELADNILARIPSIARKFKASRVDFVAVAHSSLGNFRFDGGQENDYDCEIFTLNICYYKHKVVLALVQNVLCKREDDNKFVVADM